jgi:hypothetical protein
VANQVIENMRPHVLSKGEKINLLLLYLRQQVERLEPVLDKPFDQPEAADSQAIVHDTFGYSTTTISETYNIWKRSKQVFEWDPPANNTTPRPCCIRHDPVMLAAVRRFVIDREIIQTVTNARHVMDELHRLGLFKGKPILFFFGFTLKK